MQTTAEPSTRRSQEASQGLPTTPAARLNAARAAVADRDTATAIRHIRALFAGSPYLEALFYCGVVSEQLGKLGEARSWYERVLLLDGSHRGARTRLPAVAKAAPLPSQSPQPVRPRSVPPQSQSPQVAAAEAVPYGVGFYAGLQRDASPISKNAVALIDRLTLTRRPRAWDTPIPMLLLVFGIPLSFIISFILTISVPGPGYKGHSFVGGVLFFFAGVALLIVPLIFPITFVLFRRARIYELREGLLRVTRGIFQQENDLLRTLSRCWRPRGPRTDRTDILSRVR